MLMTLVTIAALSQQSRSFTLALDAPPAEALPLFGPVREREWSPGWAPRFLHPDGGAQRDGVVFVTTTPKGFERIWVLAEYDVGAGRVGYVVTDPGYMVTEITIRIVADGAARCRATVTYRRSALDARANGEVESLDDGWAAAQGPHWQAAIDAAIARAREPRQPGVR